MGLLHHSPVRASDGDERVGGDGRHTVSDGLDFSFSAVLATVQQSIRVVCETMVQIESVKGHA